MSKIKDVLVRDFRKSDLNDVLEVANKSFAEEFAISGFDPDHIKKIVRKTYSVFGKIFLGFLRLIGKNPFKFFVAEADGKLVGTTMVNMKGRIGYIATVMVHPTYRRKGIGTKLMKNALNCIQEKDRSRAILHVVSANTTAKRLYCKLGFEKFETAVHLVANVDAVQRPQNDLHVHVRDFKKTDVEAVCDLIRRSEDPKHLKVFDFKKKDLETPLIKRLTRFSKDKKIVTVKNDRIVGYAEVSYTTSREAGRIRNIQLHPDVRPNGIEGTLVYAAVDHVRKVGTSKVMITTLSTKKELLRKLEELGFKKSLEMEGMVLEFEH